MLIQVHLASFNYLELQKSTVLASHVAIPHVIELYVIVYGVCINH